MCSVKTEADVEEKLTHMGHVAVHGTVNLAQYVATFMT